MNNMEQEILFKNLNLSSPIEKALIKQGYTIPTPIQAKAIPGLLDGRDLIGIAQTGTGKTAAFILPILSKMTENNPRKIKTLVITPTRELAAQIGESFRKYGAFLRFRHTVIFGGVGQGSQVQALNKGIDILVATPGRLLDLMNQRKISLRDVEFFVLDEADRMLDMGFIHDIKKVIAKLPSKRQSLFFSATMSSQINKLATTLLKDPIHVEVTPQATTVELINQQLYFVNQTSKEQLLLELLKQKHITSALIFTRTKHRANKVATFLNKNNIFADAIHGNKSQNARTKAITDFKKGKVKVLVATDIAARGIDIDNISHVINFELPNEPETYVHRIGRTAQAGADGTAVSFCAAEERSFLNDIEKLIKQKIEVINHQYHSELAKNAVGAAAKPPPKGKRSFSKKSNSSNRSKPNSKHKSDSKPKSNSKNRKPFPKKVKSRKSKRKPHKSKRNSRR